MSVELSNKGGLRDRRQHEETEGGMRYRKKVKRDRENEERRKERTTERRGRRGQAGKEEKQRQERWWQGDS